MASGATRVTLIRHGETTSNATNRYMGRLEEGLNDRGRRQAAQAAERLAAEGGVEILLTSPLTRTRQTAEFLERALGLAAVADDGLLEVDLGPWQGRDRGEVQAEDPERWKLWLTDPSRVRVDGLERIDQVRRRVGEALDRAVAAHPGRRIAMVTHFACVATGVLHALELPDAAYRRFPVSNASLTEVLLGDGLGRLLRFNDTAHLADLRESQEKEVEVP